jgi:hypothetical protein
MTPDQAPIVKPKNRRWYKLVDGVKHYECTACLEWKPEGAFYRQDARSFKSECKACQRIRRVGRDELFGESQPLFVGGNAGFKVGGNDFLHRDTLPCGNRFNAIPHPHWHIQGDALESGLGASGLIFPSLFVHGINPTPTNKNCLDLIK